MGKRLNNRINKLLDKYTDDMIKIASKDIDRIINDVNNDLYKETIKMYDSIIDQFYSYKTTSYIRHGETTYGTGMGINLYRANNINIINGRNPSLNISINSNDMEGGYKNSSKEDVLNYILSGVRFPFGNVPDANNLFYKCKYFTYKGSINEIFEKYGNDFKDISKDIFYSRWKKTKWCN